MQNRKAIQERRRQRKRQQNLTMILIISGIALILAAILMLPTIRQAFLPVGEIVHPELVARPMVSGNAMGDPDAPVLIEEFSDYGCGHCANFSEGTGLIIAETYVANGDVYFISRSVGSLLGSPISPQIAEAAYCAGDQEMYWEYHDYIFANQATLYANPNAPVAKYLVAFAEALALDLDAFNECVDSEKYKDRVQQDNLDATQAGVNSTPSFSINGTLIIGNRPLEDFQTAIEAALSQ